MASTIDNSTKVQVGILCTLIATCSGGAWWAASMSKDVGAVRENSDKMTASMLRLEGMVSGHERKFAVSDELFKTIDKRLDLLESKVLR